MHELSRATLWLCITFFYETCYASLPVGHAWQQALRTDLLVTQPSCLTAIARSLRFAGNSVLHEILECQQQLLEMLEESAVSSQKSGPSFSKFSALYDADRCAVASQLEVEDYPVPTHKDEDRIWEMVRREVPRMVHQMRHDVAQNGGVNGAREAMQQDTLLLPFFTEIASWYGLSVWKPNFRYKIRKIFKTPKGALRDSTGQADLAISEKLRTRPVCGQVEIKPQPK